MNKMQRNAQETDPDKQTYGPAMREKVLALAARFDAVRGKGEELKAAIEPLAVEEARAKDAEERAAREAEEAAQLRQQEEARKAEEARAAAEAAAAAADARAVPKSAGALDAVPSGGAGQSNAAHADPNADEAAPEEREAGRSPDKATDHPVDDGPPTGYDLP